MRQLLRSCSLAAVSVVVAAGAGFGRESSPASTLNGVLVLDVMAGRQAEKAGILKGDVIVSCNATPTPDIAALRAAMTAASSAENVELVVYRGDSQLTMRTQPGFLGIRGRGSIEGVPSYVAHSPDSAGLLFQLRLWGVVGLLPSFLLCAGALLNLKSGPRWPQYLQAGGSGIVAALSALSLIFAILKMSFPITGSVVALMGPLYPIGWFSFAGGYLAACWQRRSAARQDHMPEPGAML